MDLHADGLGLRRGESAALRELANAARLIPNEGGLHLRKQPVAPRVVQASVLIRNHHGVRDSAHFLA